MLAVREINDRAYDRRRRRFRTTHDDEGEEGDAVDNGRTKKTTQGTETMRHRQEFYAFILEKQLADRTTATPALTDA